MDTLTQQLLETYQRGFPLSAAPFAEMATTLGTDEATVIDRLTTLQQEGMIGRIGPVFNHRQAGASTLAAMQVPSERLESVAELVNQYPGVNHNYEREHAFNLWFVVTAPDHKELTAILNTIERRTGLTIMNLPMETAYHIDLGFKLAI